MTIVYEEREQQARHFATLLGATPVTTFDDMVAAANADLDETLVVFGPSAPLAEAVCFADQCRAQRPRLGVVLLRERVDVAVVAEAMRGGVREVVDAFDHVAVLTACSRSREESRHLPPDPPGRTNGRPLGPPGPEHGRATVPMATASLAAGNGSLTGGGDDGPKDAKIITVFSAKGGCGKSTIATNLAVALADDGARRVCLVDLDLAFGDVAIMLQLDPQRTIADAVPVADRIDETGLRLLLTPYAAGIDTLLAPVQPALAEEVSRNLVADLLHLARGVFDYIVIDTASHFTEQVLAALDASHEYVLVTVPELPALKNLRVTLDMFDLLDYRRESRIVVLNRADEKVGLSTSDAERVARVPIRTFIPSSRDVPISVNRGVPITVSQPTHPVSTAIRELAGRISGTVVPVQGRGRRGLILRKGRS